MRSYILSALVACFLLQPAPAAYGQIALAPDADIAASIISGNYNLLLTGTARWNSLISINTAARAGLTIDGRGAVVTVANGTYVLFDFTQNNSVTIRNTTFVPSGPLPVANPYLIGYATANITSNLNLEGTTFNGFSNTTGGKFGTILSAYALGTNITVNAGTLGLTFSNNRGQFDTAGAVAVTGSNLTFNGKVTFDSNWTGNYGGAVAVYELTNRLIFNGDTTFTNNHSVVFGGALDLWGGGATVQFNGPATFNGNYVYYSDAVTPDSPLHVLDQNPRGGAINIGYLPAAPLASVTFNANATFSNNRVISTDAGKSALGGAISVYGNTLSQNYSITFNQAGIFEGNYVYATGGDASGGAIYYDSLAAQLNLGSGSRFINNYAKTNGGAIYLQAGTINLNAATADIVFQGNRHGASFDVNYAPVLNTGTPNSIYLGSNGFLNLIAGPGYKIEFHDPVASGTTTTITVVKSGLGEAIFYGDNGATTSYNSDIRGNTTVQAGTFTLADGVAYGNTGFGAFLTQSGGTVRGGNGAELRAASLVIQTGGTLAANGGTFNVNTPIAITLQAGSILSGTGTLTAASNLSLGGTITADVATAQTLNVAQVMAGAGGAVTKTGTGTLVLSAVNTYPGATNISAGTLGAGIVNAFAQSTSVVVNTGATLALNNFGQTAQNLSGSGAIALGSATLNVANTTNTVFGGAISGTGVVQKTGTGTLTLSGASTYSGGTSISGARLIATTGSALGTGTATIASGSMLELAFTGSETMTNTLAGTGSVQKTGTGVLSLTGSGSSVGIMDITAGTLALNQTGPFIAGTYTTRNGAATSLGQAATLTVDGAFTQENTATLTVDAGVPRTVITANTAAIDGTLTVTGLNFGTPTNASQLDAQAYTILQASSAITGDFTTVNIGVPANPVDYLVASGRKSANNFSYLVGLGLTWLAIPSQANGVFTLANAGDSFNVDVVLANQTGPFASGWDGQSLTKFGLGTLTLSAINTYTGATNISAGTLRTGIANAFAQSASVVVSAGATLDLNGYGQTANNLSGSGTVSLGSAMLTATNTANTIFAGTITGTGSVTKNGTATLTLSGTNTYSNGTTISAGRLIASNGSALGTGTANVATGSSTLELAFAGNGTLANTLSGDGTVEKTGGGILSLTGSGSSVATMNVIAGTLALNQGGLFNAGDYTTQSGAATVIGAQTGLTVSGTFTQGTNASLTIAAATPGPVITANDAQIGGTLTVTGLNLIAPARSSDLASQQLTVLQTTAGIAGDFTTTNLGLPTDLADYLVASGGKSADDSRYLVGLGLTWLADESRANGLFTLTNADDSFIVDTVLTNQTGSFTSGWDGQTLTKNGLGTLTLSAQNEYTGATIVNVGTLGTGIADAFAQSTSVVVNAGATLALNDFSQTANNLSGSGTISLGSATLNATNTTGTVFSGTINGTGSVTKNGTATLTLSGINTYSGGTTILDGRLIATNGSALGTGTADMATGSSTLELAFASSGTLANTLSGDGTVEKTGGGALSLTGSGSSVGALDVSAGTLALNLTGPFTAGTYTIEAGATTTIGTNAHLTVTGIYTQNAGAHLNITAATPDPIITANSAQIGGTLTVTGLNLGAPARASDLLSQQVTVLETDLEITGDFTSVNAGLPANPVDYLVASGRKSEDNLRYLVGLGLTWLADESQANGLFTLTNATDTFDVDVVLADQTGTFASGWNGQDLTKSGPGILILSALNTYTGATIINDGTLRTGIADAFADSTSVLVNADATLDLNNFDQTAQNLSGDGTISLGAATLTASGTANTTYGGVINGTGTVEKNGTGELTLTGTNTYSGGTTISDGRLVATNGSALGTGTADVASPATLELAFADNGTLANTLSGDGTVEKTGGGVLSLTGSGSSIGAVDVTAGTLALNQTGEFTADTYTTRDGAATSLGPAATLVVAGTFTQQANSVLNVAVGAQDPVITADRATLGGTLMITGLNMPPPIKASDVTSQRFTVIQTTGGVFDDFDSVDFGGAASSVDYLLLDGGIDTGNLAYSVGFELTWNAGSPLGNGFFTLQNADSLFDVDLLLADQTGPFTSGWSGSDLTKEGAGTLILSFANTYTGATIINAGTLGTGIANAFANSTSVEVNTGATLALNDFSQIAQNLSGSGAISLGTATLTANNTIGTVFSGAITGTGGLQKTGADTLTLSGTNTYSGGTAISAGRLIATNGSALGTGTADVAALSTLELAFINSGILTNTLSGAGTVEKTGTGMLNLTATGSSVGTVDVAEGTLILAQAGEFDATTYTTQTGATTTIGASASLDVDGVFTQQTGATLEVSLGAQEPIIMAGTANLAGDLKVNGFNSNFAFSSYLTAQRFNVIETTGGVFNDFDSVDFGGAASNVDYLILDGQVTNGGLDYSVGFGLTWYAGPALGNGVFTLTNASDSFNEDMVLTNQTGPFASGWDGQTLTKNGLGTLILSAQNTYTGATIINAGTLSTGIANAFANSTSVEVNTGATLALNDFDQIASNLSGDGTVSLGAATLNATNTADTIFSGTITGTGSVQKTGAGTLTLAGVDIYSGGTIISAGRLIATNEAALGTGAANIGSGSTLELAFTSNGFMANTLAGAGTVEKTGTGVLSLTGTGYSLGSVNVVAGALALDQTGSFITTTYTTQTGATTTIGSAATLDVAGIYTQQTNSALEVIIGTQEPIITANTASLAGDLRVDGFAPSFAHSSSLTARQFTIIQTTAGISGDFASVDFGGAASNVDYLTLGGFITNAGRDYSIDFGLTWYAGPALGNGVFTLTNASDSFDVDTSLINQTGPFASGWDGQSLTKNGLGTLTLSAPNSYTGTTTVNGGVLIIYPAATLVGQVVVGEAGVLSGTGALTGGAVINRGTISAFNALGGNIANTNTSHAVIGHLDNFGDILLAGTTVGNTLTVQGGMVSNGGRLIINTVLSDDSSPTDRLILDGGNTTGQTSLVVYNAGGTGGNTQRGILVVDAINGAITSADAFTLDPASPAFRVQQGPMTLHSTLAIGGYDYTLLKGGFGGNGQSWYLVSNLMPSARPEAGVYLGNREASENMFSHTLQDRLNGYFSTVDPVTGEKGFGSIWGRAIGDTTRSYADNKRLRTQTETTALHAGMDIFQSTGDQFGSVRLGLMGGVGAANSKTESQSISSYHAKGDTKGYMIGGYATWFQNPDMRSGFYADTWVEHSWFDNETRGSGLAREKYDSTMLAASLELGYSLPLARTESASLSLDPIFQVIYTHYSSDNFAEAGGTRIVQSEGGNLGTRVGARLRGQYDFKNGISVEPFVETSWWHNSNTNAIHMNQDIISSNTPRNLAEIKAGISARLTKSLSLSLGVTGQLGGKDYSKLGGMLGVRFEW